MSAYVRLWCTHELTCDNQARTKYVFWLSIHIFTQRDFLNCAQQPLFGQTVEKTTAFSYEKSAPFTDW